MFTVDGNYESMCMYESTYDIIPINYFIKKVKCCFVSSMEVVNTIQHCKSHVRTGKESIIGHSAPAALAKKWMCTKRHGMG